MFSFLTVKNISYLSIFYDKTFGTLTVTTIIFLNSEKGVKYHLVGGTDVCHLLASINSLQNQKITIRLILGQIEKLGIITVSSFPNFQK